MIVYTFYSANTVGELYQELCGVDPSYQLIVYTFYSANRVGELYEMLYSEC